MNELSDLLSRGFDMETHWRVGLGRVGRDGEGITSNRATVCSAQIVTVYVRQSTLTEALLTFQFPPSLLLLCCSPILGPRMFHSTRVTHSALTLCITPAQTRTPHMHALTTLTMETLSGQRQCSQDTFVARIALPSTSVLRHCTTEILDSNS